MLKPEGHIVLDVAGIQKTFICEDQHLALDRYVIIEPGETWQIYNWFQHFSPQMIESELKCAGFTAVEMAGDLTGEPLTENGDLLGIIATPS
ncbi:MAG: hypothetical protein ACH255_08045 [Candidatus Thiodiazotropha sp.]